MNVKEAVKVALEYVADLFKRESLSNIGLEEVVFDSATNEWKVTVGFSRPWDYDRPGTLKGMFDPTREKQARREYKVVHVDAETGEVRSVEIRAQT